MYTVALMVVVVLQVGEGAGGFKVRTPYATRAVAGNKCALVSKCFNISRCHNFSVYVYKVTDNPRQWGMGLSIKFEDSVCPCYCPTDVPDTLSP